MMNINPQWDDMQHQQQSSGKLQRTVLVLFEQLFDFLKALFSDRFLLRTWHGKVSLSWTLITWWAATRRFGTVRVSQLSIRRGRPEWKKTLLFTYEASIKNYSRRESIERLAKSSRHNWIIQSTILFISNPIIICESVLIDDARDWRREKFASNLGSLAESAALSIATEGNRKFTIHLRCPDVDFHRTDYPREPSSISTSRPCVCGRRRKKGSIERGHHMASEQNEASAPHSEHLSRPCVVASHEEGGKKQFRIIRRELTKRKLHHWLFHMRFVSKVFVPSCESSTSVVLWISRMTRSSPSIWQKRIFWRPRDTRMSPKSSLINRQKTWSESDFAG